MAGEQRTAPRAIRFDGRRGRQGPRLRRDRGTPPLCHVWVLQRRLCAHSKRNSWPRGVGGRESCLVMLFGDAVYRSWKAQPWSATSNLVCATRRSRLFLRISPALGAGSSVPLEIHFFTQAILEIGRPRSAALERSDLTRTVSRCFCVVHCDPARIQNGVYKLDSLKMLENACYAFRPILDGQSHHCRRLAPRFYSLFNPTFPTLLRPSPPIAIASNIHPKQTQ